MLPCSVPAAVRMSLVVLCISGIRGPSVVIVPLGMTAGTTEEVAKEAATDAHSARAAGGRSLEPCSGIECVMEEIDEMGVTRRMAGEAADGCWRMDAREDNGNMEV